MGSFGAGVDSFYGGVTRRSVGGQLRFFSAIQFAALCCAIMALFIRRGGCDFSYRYSL